MDISRQWFKARVGLEVPETHRDVAFCSYVLIESAPEVLIVPDATQDSRFCANPLVLGYPYIRFYAGTPLRVNGIKIGTLCIIDNVSRTKDQFGEREALMLQDVAAMISSLVIERRRDMLQLQSELAKLTMNVLNGIKKPLETLTEQGNEVGRELRRLRDCNDSTNPLREFGRSVNGFANALKSLDKILELNLKAVESLVNDPAASNKKPRMTFCSFQRKLELLESVLPCLNPLLIEQDWRDPLVSLVKSTERLTCFSHPEVLSLALCTLIAGKMHGNSFFQSLEIALKVIHKNVRISDGALHNLVKDCSDYKKHSNHAWNIGEIVFTISQSLPSNINDDISVNECFESLQQVLLWIGGTLSVESIVQKSTLLYHVTIPYRSLVEDAEYVVPPMPVNEPIVDSKGCHTVNESTQCLQGNEDDTMPMSFTSPQPDRKFPDRKLEQVPSSLSLQSCSLPIVFKPSATAVVPPMNDGNPTTTACRPIQVLSMVTSFMTRLLFSPSSLTRSFTSSEGSHKNAHHKVHPTANSSTM